MALLSRLFGGRKKGVVKSPNGYDDVPEFNPWQPVPLDEDNVSFMVFRECERRGPRVMFDTTTVQLVKCGPEQHGLLDVEGETGLKWNRQRSDAAQLGEMVFGAVAMAYTGPTCKVHVLRGSTTSPDTTATDTLVMSRVFPIPRCTGRRVRTQASSGTSLDDSCSSTGSELSLLRLDGVSQSLYHPRSSSMECPPPGGRRSEDSGLSSVDSYVGPPSCLPTPYGTPISTQGSGASLGSHGSLLKPYGSSDLMLMTSRDDVTLRHTSRTRLAVCLLVKMDGAGKSVLEDTLLQYSPQLEHLLARLQISIEKVFLIRRMFVRSIHNCCSAARQDLVNLLMCPRLPRPVWLGLNSDTLLTSHQRRHLAELFVAELTGLTTELDTKEHNCFITTLLTAVLTHHLTWVTTVAPLAVGDGTRLDGAAGHPPRPARTLVVGRRTNLIKRLVLVLSYFIRARLVTETMPWSLSPLRSSNNNNAHATQTLQNNNNTINSEARAESGVGTLKATRERMGGSTATLKLDDVESAGVVSEAGLDGGRCVLESGRDGRADEKVAGSNPGAVTGLHRLDSTSNLLRGSGSRSKDPLDHRGEKIAEPQSDQSKSRFYVQLDGRITVNDDSPAETFSRSRFYRSLPRDDASDGRNLSGEEKSREGRVSDISCGMNGDGELINNVRGDEGKDKHVPTECSARNGGSQSSTCNRETVLSDVRVDLTHSKLLASGVDMCGSPVLCVNKSTNSGRTASEVSECVNSGLKEPGLYCSTNISSECGSSHRVGTRTVHGKNGACVESRASSRTIELTPNGEHSLPEDSECTNFLDGVKDVVDGVRDLNVHEDQGTTECSDVAESQAHGIVSEGDGVSDVTSRTYPCVITVTDVSESGVRSICDVGDVTAGNGVCRSEGTSQGLGESDEVSLKSSRRDDERHGTLDEEVKKRDDSLMKPSVMPSVMVSSQYASVSHGKPPTVSQKNSCQPNSLDPQPPVPGTSSVQPSPQTPSMTLQPPRSLASISQTRSCQNLASASTETHSSLTTISTTSQHRRTLSSTDVSAPVKFLVGDDEETAADQSEVVLRERKESGSRVESGGHGEDRAAESSDEDSGFSGCERCAGLILLERASRPSGAEAPVMTSSDDAIDGPVTSPAVGGGGAISRRHSDSIRDTSHYLRGYRSFRFSQPAGRARKWRHFSDGTPPSPPPPPPSAVGEGSVPPSASDSAVEQRQSVTPAKRKRCRCGDALTYSGKVRKQVALLDTGRGGPGRQSLAPWACIGAGGSDYVPDMPLWGCDSRQVWESRLRHDLAAATYSGDECTCVVADCDAGTVEVLSSHAFPVERAGGLGLGVVFAPLVSTVVESVMRLHTSGAPATLVLHHLESHLASLAAKAAEMAQLLINSSMTSLLEVTQLLGVDSSDVPLLLSAASVICPEVTDKYGLSIR